MQENVQTVPDPTADCRRRPGRTARRGSTSTHPGNERRRSQTSRGTSGIQVSPRSTPVNSPTPQPSCRPRSDYEARPPQPDPAHAQSQASPQAAPTPSPETAVSPSGPAQKPADQPEKSH